MLSLFVAMQLGLVQDAVIATPRAIQPEIRAVPVLRPAKTQRNRLMAQEAEVDQAYREGVLQTVDWAKMKHSLANAQLRLAMAEAEASSDSLMTLDLKQAVDHAQRVHQMTANVLKSRHDTSKAVIQNVR